VATLTVTDDDGDTASASATVDVTGPPPPPGTCTVDCLRSTGLALSARLRKGVVTVTGKVTVMDETGASMRNANVNVTWTLPDGTQLSQTASTNRKGIAKLTAGPDRGTYVLTVTGISKAGLTFDPDNSVLSKSITK